MVSDVRRVLGSNLPGIALTGLMLVSIPLALATAAVGWAALTALVVAAGQFAEWYTRRDEFDKLHRVLARASFDVHLRSALRTAAMPVLLLGLAESAPLVIATWCAWLLWLMVSAIGLLTAARELNQAGAAARGLGVKALEPRVGSDPTSGNWPHTAAVLVLAALAQWSAEAAWLGAAGITAVSAVYLYSLARRIQRTLRLSGTRRMKAINKALREYRPEVVLYAGGQASTGYQSNVWLPTLDGLDQRVLVIFQNPALWNELKPSKTPVICVQKAAEYLTLDVSSVKLVMFPGNNGNNINLLRLPHLRTTFIGHGDSDKLASVNPFTKVYDEIWVAGQAGQDRYGTAGVPIPADHFVHVGRPQLTQLARKLAAAPPRQRTGTPTVLYAPTWEGWTTEEHHTSLVRCGVQIVKALQAAKPGVRIIFRPHPLTGTRSAAAAAALKAVIDLLPESDISYPGQGELYDCFAEADLMITDVSSVVSDFLFTDKPYSVVNTSGLSDEDFVAENPSISASYLIDGNLNGLAAALDAARADEFDVLAEKRHALRTYILGPTGSDEPFQKAVDQAIALNDLKEKKRVTV
ncbi:CDP-glycerol glycerophosphotransferase family protein [Catellatospora bangladeshensis]|uniref:CDP-glycerol glycerophosphotransferase n=1 Tax=Catellatospora bangladeshensis TaxID=310355 RepID=A0A8J3JJE7_9ACTN|nr:CDP-glycerol glycerophosphotransferase family protein [Catellatospora bangladeshensis]GIF83654.1 hypothetical protein Cba03nite_50030 [Catellatospora bangladeshensis]